MRDSQHQGQQRNEQQRGPAARGHDRRAVAARQVGRPVHWMAARGESFLSDNQARDTVTDKFIVTYKAGEPKPDMSWQPLPDI